MMSRMKSDSKPWNGSCPMMIFVFIGVLPRVFSGEKRFLLRRNRWQSNPRVGLVLGGMVLERPLQPQRQR
jgi:hypothetical protein